MTPQEREEEKAEPDALKVGDMVSWDSSGGRARGKVSKIIRSGKVNIPETEISLNATEEDPVALIKLYRGGEETDTVVGHRFSTLRKI